MVDSKQFTNSSRKRRASRRISVRRYWLPTLSTAAITRLPNRKFFSSTARYCECFWTLYSSHCSTCGNDEAFLILCIKQYIKQTTSPRECYPWSAAAEEWKKLLATETGTLFTDMAIEPPSSMVCCDAKIHQKPNVGPSWKKTSVFLRNHSQIFPEPLRAHENSTKDCMGLLTNFKKKMQQTKLQARHLAQVEVSVHSLLLNITNAINMGTKRH